MTTPPEAGPAAGERTWVHREALGEMARAVRDALLASDAFTSPGCWTVLYWQAVHESPAADARAKVGALAHLLGELACLVDAWCEQVDAALASVAPTDEPIGPEDPAAVARVLTEVAGWLDRSARALLVGAAEMKYLAAELAGAREGAGAVAARPAERGAGAEPSSPPKARRPKAKAKR